MRWLTSVAWLTLACGGGRVVDDASVSDGGNDADADDDSGLILDDASADGGKWHFFDGGRDCFPPDGNAYTYRSCCVDGGYCDGVCVQNDEGQLRCDCYGLTGGCMSGLVCCKTMASCVSTQFCGLGK